MKPRRTICILTFHGLGCSKRQLPVGEENYWLEPTFFEAILERARDWADVRITFDDSNSSDVEIALPALLKRNLRGTFFVVSGRLGKPSFLTSEDVRELARADMSIGSHGTQHRPWRQLGATDLDEELNLSRQRLEQVLGAAVTEAACPFGSYDRRVIRALRAAGYSQVYTSDGGRTQAADWMLPRNSILRRHTLEDVVNVVQSRPGPLSVLFRKLKLAVKRLR
jgi:peptidoglycan/xylan/chitin deacetylase (PgdA/CDA1 family)